MKLLDSLLDAIVRLEGDALVMHVGEKPYVITASASMNAYRGPLAWGQVELSSRVLTFDAVSTMLAQILPDDQRRALDEMGAIEHEILPPDGILDRFTVVAARGGEDVWVEVRRKPVQPAAPDAAAEGAQAATDAAAVEQASTATEVEPQAATPVDSAPEAAAEEEARAVADAAPVEIAEAVVEAAPVATEINRGNEDAHAEVHEYSTRIELPDLPEVPREPQPGADAYVAGTDAAPVEPEALAPVDVENAAQEPVETIVVALPGEGAEAVSLDAAHDAAIQVIDDEAQGLPTEEEVDAMMAGAASALLTSGLSVDHIADEPIEPIEVEAAGEAEAIDDVEEQDDQDEGEIVALDEIEITSPPVLLEAEHLSLTYDLSLNAEEPAESEPPQQPETVETPETIQEIEAAAPVEETAVEEAEAATAAVEPEPIAEAEEAPRVILPFTPAAPVDAANPTHDAEPPAEENVVDAGNASPEFTTANVLSFEDHVANTEPLPGFLTSDAPAEPVESSAPVAPPAETVEAVEAVEAVESSPVETAASADAPGAASIEEIEQIEQIVQTPDADVPAFAAADPSAAAAPDAAALDVVEPASDPLAPSSTIADIESPAPPAPTDLPVAAEMHMDTTTTEAPPVETAGFAAPAFSQPAASSAPAGDTGGSHSGAPEAGEAAASAPEPIKTEVVTTPYTPSEDAALMQTLRAAAKRGAATVYVVAQSKPMIRVDGDILPLESEPVLSAADVERLVVELAPPRRREALQNGPVEWLCDIPEIGRVRCTTFRDHRGPGVLFRMFPERAISADQLGLTPEVQALCQQSDGLVLVTGARASGKSTLLNAFVDLINKTRSDHVITVETQIGFVHESRKSFISQRETRGDLEFAASVARAALREDPDVMMIEDLKSAELVSVALDAAESGRLVLASVPAASTIPALERLIELFPADRRVKARASLATALRGVIGQVLLRRNTGGRAAAREILLNTPAVSALVLEGKMFQLPVALDGGRRLGMVPLTDSLAAHVRDGSVFAGEAYRKALDRAALLAALKRDGIDTSFAERMA